MCFLMYINHKTISYCALAYQWNVALYIYIYDNVVNCFMILKVKENKLDHF